jgi:hypothetical protein
MLLELQQPVFDDSEMFGGFLKKGVLELCEIITHKAS